MDFLTFLQALSKSNAEFVIVGGVAARLYGSTRLTHDVDVVPRLDPDAWPQLIERIWALGGRPRIPEPVEAIQDLRNVESWMADKGMRALSFRSTDGSAEIDLLMSESPNYPELQRRARRVELDGVSYFVASIDDLIEMKKRAGRPQDRLDVEELERLRDAIEGE